MTYELENQAQNEAKLTITLDAETVDKEIARAYKEAAKQLSIPGFRKGKTPRNVLDQYIDQEKLFKNVAENLMNFGYIQAAAEGNIEAVDYPTLANDGLKEGEDFTFTAHIVLRPEPVIGDYKSFELAEINLVANENAIDDQIKRICEDAAVTKPVKDAIKEGDVVDLSYKGTIDGEAFAGGSADNYSLNIGSGTFIPGFEEQLVGHNAGEDFTITVTFPEDYHSETLAGKEAQFEINVKEVNRKFVPEMTDELAQQLTGLENIEMLREAIAHSIAQEHKEESRRFMEDQLVGQLLTIMDVEVPNVMVEQELDHYMENMKGSLKQQGIEWSQYLSYVNKKESDVREEKREEAERNVKANLGLLAIAKKENITVDDSDIDLEISGAAKMMDKPVHVIRKMLEDAGQLEALETSILLQKVKDAIIGWSVIKTGTEAEDIVKKEISKAGMPVADGDESAIPDGMFEAQEVTEAEAVEEDVDTDSEEDVIDVDVKEAE